MGNSIITNKSEIEVRSKDIRIVSTDEIKPNPNNKNKHSEDQINRLCEIIKYQGFRSPLIVSNRSGLLVSGHGRLLAAKKLGLIHVPVLHQDFDSDEQEYAAGVSENAIALWAELDLSGINSDLGDLGPDFDLDLLGIKNFTVDVADKEPQCDEDEVPEKVEAKTKRGDIYQLGRHRLMCGDSTMIDDVENLMAGEKADLWITDPPYGVDYVAKNAAVHGGVVHNAVGKEIKNDTQTPEELKPFWTDVASNVSTVMNDVCAMYWFGASSAMMMMMMIALDEAGWNNRHTLIWVKQAMVFGRSDYHYKHEPIIYGWRKDGTHEWYGDRKQDSVFNFDRPHRSDMHPTTKPVELIERLMANSSKQDQLVLDTFGGSGTTLIASEKLNRKCFMMELDPKYCDVIIARFEKFTGQKAELIS